MESTRRARIVLAFAGGGAGLAAAFSSELLLAIPIGAVAWLLVNRLAFARTLGRVRDADPPVVSQSLADDRVEAGDSTTLRVRIDEPDGGTVGLEGALELSLPASVVTDAARTCEVAEIDAAGFEVPIRAPLVGSFEIGPPRLRLSSGRGLFRETLRVGLPCSLLVEPRVRDAAVRDDAPTETGLTRVLIDRRASMRDGRPGRTKLDYAREIGLALTERAAADGTPIRVSFVDHDGVSDDDILADDTLADDAEDAGATDATRDATAPEGDPAGSAYQRVRQRLYDLVPDEEALSTDIDTAAVETNGAEGADPLRVRRDAVRRAETLDGVDTFARTLAPYVETMATYSDRLSARPLFRGVTEASERGADSRIVIVTDDSHREELLGAARLAAVRDLELSVFVLPSALFAERGPAEIDALDREYREFQSFVDELRDHDGVTVFEAGPQERPSTTSERAEATRGVS